MDPVVLLLSVQEPPKGSAVLLLHPKGPFGQGVLGSVTCPLVPHRQTVEQDTSPHQVQRRWASSVPA